MASPLLKLEHVSKSYGRRLTERIALRDVSLELEAGELVVVWGRRRSGRSTLLRVAAGVDTPSRGQVHFNGQLLADGAASTWEESGIGYCHRSFRPGTGRVVLELLIVNQLARGVSASLARARARSALERAGAGRCATLGLTELSSAEAVRVAIARVLTFHPALIVIDEPTIGVDLLARDEILLLLRSLADEGVAVLASTGETTGLSGADRALSLSEGALHGHLAPELAQVLPLYRPAASRVSA
jgi:ABC-type sugar transport system ATPase subunit